LTEPPKSEPPKSGPPTSGPPTSRRPKSGRPTSEPKAPEAPGAGVPEWLRRLVADVDEFAADSLPASWRPPDGGGRPAAVLILFGPGPDGPDVLLIQRADSLNSHAGQPAFPGGAVEPGDNGPVGAALREAAEETGLDPSGVDVLTTMPELFIPPSGYRVTPVLGWWRTPSAVSAHDPGEVASVARVPIAQLADPANRLRVWHLRGSHGPAFRVADMLVWGFTAGLLDRLIRLGGWERPWSGEPVEDLPPRVRALARRRRPGATS
jgi:8-oxo-dGTP pyrophosphatase MutT (NUDIX family)